MSLSLSVFVETPGSTHTAPPKTHTLAQFVPAAAPTPSQQAGKIHTKKLHAIIDFTHTPLKSARLLCIEKSEQSGREENAS